MAALPYPPLELMTRVGAMPPGDPHVRFDEIGAGFRDVLESHLPEEWSFEGQRVLDFGCGAGRVLRRFEAEAEAGTEVWGSEIDPSSVAWLEANLAPPFHAVLHGERPPLALPDGHFDLIYAASVYTHIAEHWAAWLLEMHRLLAPDGLLFVSLLGQSMLGPLLGEPWEEDRVGMLRVSPGTPWDVGGPTVFVSEWWLRAHWGRAFEVVGHWPGQWDTGYPHGRHDVALLRALPQAPGREELEAPEPGESRELDATAFNLDVLWREMELKQANLFQMVDALNATVENTWATIDFWRATAEAWEERYDEVLADRDRGLPGPVRGAARLVRRAR